MDGDRGIARRLVGLALPVIGLNVLAVVSLAVDTAMCGRLPEAETALAALGFSTQIVFLLLTVMIGLSIGTVALVARAHGLGDSTRVNHLLGQATLLTVLVGAVIGAGGNAVARPLLAALGASEATLETGLHFLRPMLAFAVFSYLNVLYAAVLRGVGNTRLPFLIGLGVNALNVVLDYLLIFGKLGMPALGVQGAAIATVSSQACGAVAMLLMLRFRLVPGLRLTFGGGRVDFKMLRELARVGLPAALDTLILQGAFMAVVGMLGRIDEVAVAAHVVGLRIQGLAFVPGLSVSQATSAMVGQALGAGREGEARAVTRASMIVCTLLMSGIAVLLIAGAGPIVSIFDVEPGSRLEQLAIDWMRILGYGMPIVGMHIALLGVLRGAGATGTALTINIISTLAFQIPLSFLLAFTFDLGAIGVWLAFPLAFLVKLFLEAAVYWRGRWAKLGLHT